MKVESLVNNILQDNKQIVISIYWLPGDVYILKCILT